MAQKGGLVTTGKQATGAESARALTLYGNHRADLDSRIADIQRWQDVRDGWESLKDPLAQYACPVLCSWIANGGIFSRISQLTGIRLRGARELFEDPDAATELSGLTVSTAVKSFLVRMEQGDGWHPEGGASLKTYFIGQCLMCFPNEYRRWLREQCAGGLSVAIPTGQEHFDVPDGTLGPERLAELHIESMQILEQAPPRTRTALAFASAGYSQREIARHLNTTPKGVEMLLRRYRKKYGSV